jgi:hypothetical protein
MQVFFGSDRYIAIAMTEKLQTSAMCHGFRTGQQVVYLKYEVAMTCYFTERTFPTYISFSAFFASQDASKHTSPTVKVIGLTPVLEL